MENIDIAQCAGADAVNSRSHPARRGSQGHRIRVDLGQGQEVADRQHADRRDFSGIRAKSYLRSPQVEVGWLSGRAI